MEGLDLWRVWIQGGSESREDMHPDAPWIQGGSREDLDPGRVWIQTREDPVDVSNCRSQLSDDQLENNRH